MIAVTFFVLPDLAADKLPGSSCSALVAAARARRARGVVPGGEPVAGLLMRHRLTEPLGKLTARSAQRALFAWHQRASCCSQWRSSSSTWRHLLVRQRHAPRPGFRRRADRRSGGHAGVDGADLVRRMGRAGRRDDLRPRLARNRRPPMPSRSRSPSDCCSSCSACRVGPCGGARAGAPRASRAPAKPRLSRSGCQCGLARARSSASCRTSFVKRTSISLNFRK